MVLSDTTGSNVAMVSHSVSLPVIGLSEPRGLSQPVSIHTARPPPRPGFSQPSSSQVPSPPLPPSFCPYMAPMVTIPQVIQNTYFDYNAYLSQSSCLYITQQIEMLELLIDWETPNRYAVRDEFGNQIFYVGEISNMCIRRCCGNRRSFKLDIRDRNGFAVLIFERELKYDCFCGLICPDQLNVMTPDGQQLGSVTRDMYFCLPSFSIRDARGETQLKIKGPFCTQSCLGAPVSFNIVAKNELCIGSVTKVWSGLIQEYFTDTDNFYVSFPPDLDVSLKAVCMAVAFLIVSTTTSEFTN